MSDSSWPLPKRPGMTCRARSVAQPRDKLNELATGLHRHLAAESDGADAFTPWALASIWEPRLRMGTAIVPATPGRRHALRRAWRRWPMPRPAGSRSASVEQNVIVERWNDVPFVEPYKKCANRALPA